MPASPTLHITLGDPTGIGPEVVLRALNVWDGPAPVVHGHAEVLERAARLCQLPLPDVQLRQPSLAEPFARPGETQLAYLEQVSAAIAAGEIEALVTAPVNKATLHRAGFAFPGHTEFLAHATGQDDVGMLFVADRLRVLLATVHLPLAEVPKTLSPDLVSRRIVLGVQALATDWGIADPTVAVAALNPHAGEAGLFGDEEVRLLQPGITQARTALARLDLAATVVGPFPADSLYSRAVGGEYDLVLAMYHDQGLIPVKLLGPGNAVNVTVGLPFVRTSPDHGTAQEIAWKSQADPAGFLAALRLARALADRRRASSKQLAER